MTSRFSVEDFDGSLRPARSVREIMRADGEAFVRWAYITMLGRQADADGLAFYLRRMSEGKTKVSILKQLKKSAEGRIYGANLPGLAIAIRRAMLKRAPVVGPVYLWLLNASDSKRLIAPAE
ncbi:DUF4214 domain-containing protein [Sphingobium sp. AN558]|uniref:DUF4214 domain-containing protein n=1 Tax=Sphingobium sp. AN558 TaxID=3133442 RepID=UPI0030BA8755